MDPRIEDWYNRLSEEGRQQLAKLGNKVSRPLTDDEVETQEAIDAFLRLKGHGNRDDSSNSDPV